MIKSKCQSCLQIGYLLQNKIVQNSWYFPDFNKIAPETVL